MTLSFNDEKNQHLDELASGQLEPRQKKAALFISFEGIDGCGKTTQLQYLNQALKAEGYQTLCLREPGGTAVSEEIRELLLAKEELAIDARTELMLFLAARSQIVVEQIKPALEAGVIVLCDRFADSTMAYQGYGRGLELSEIRELNNFACRGLSPDLTLLLDLSKEQFMARLSKREASEKNRFDNESVEFLSRVHQGFAELAEQEPERIKRVSTARDKELSRQEILRLVMAKLRT
ncbi:MAG: dTMP kinase [Eubacteriales bacterium]|nr:dTMP kinase [Eubacteriales bacterium]